MNWHEHLKYDESVPGCLVWIRFAANNRIKPGDVAGKFQPKHKNAERGYYRVYVIDQSYAHHRIIWEMFNRSLEEGEQVDHIDGNTKNNNITNLRVVSGKENCYNQKRRCTNKSGVCGMYINDNGNGRLYWTAMWMEGNVRRGRMYSIDKHGYDEAFQMALKARQAGIEKIKQSGITITERHGT